MGGMRKHPSSWCRGETGPTMPGWWRRLCNMPDRERASLVVAVGGGLVIGLLYVLGLFALYLRVRYLEPLPTNAPSPSPTTVVTAELSPTSTATLFPTITPRPAP